MTTDQADHPALTSLTERPARPGPGGLMTTDETDRPALRPVAERYRCGTCGGGGLTSTGETCGDCHGLGHC